MNIESYLTERQLSRQWGEVLFAMAQELEEQFDDAALGMLMFKTGTRLAQGFPADDNASITDVEKILNEIWLQCDWGWVTLIDRGNDLLIEHHFSPIAATFGKAAVGWAGEILTGFYSAVFKQLGCGSELLLRRQLDRRGQVGEANSLLFVLESAGR